MPTLNKITMTFNEFDNSIHAAGPSFSRAKYLALAEDEQQRLYKAALPFIVQCSKMGPSSALELLCALGTWMNNPASFEREVKGA